MELTLGSREYTFTTSLGTLISHVPLGLDTCLSSSASPGHQRPWLLDYQEHIPPCHSFTLLICEATTHVDASGWQNPGHGPPP